MPRQLAFPELSELLEEAFRDDLRNGVSHADYVIWDDGIRLSNRNGGHAAKLSFNELNDALMRGGLLSSAKRKQQCGSPFV